MNYGQFLSLSFIPVVSLIRVITYVAIFLYLVFCL